MQEDLDYFLQPHKAAKAFEILDRDQDGRVSLHDIRDAILQIYKVPCALFKQHSPFVCTATCQRGCRACCCPALSSEAQHLHCTGRASAGSERWQLLCILLHQQMSNRPANTGHCLGQQSPLLLNLMLSFPRGC